MDLFNLHRGALGSISCAVLLALLVPSGAEAGGTKNIKWTGGSDDAIKRWSDPDNWDPKEVPSNKDYRVEIPANSGTIVWDMAGDPIVGPNGEVTFKAVELHSLTIQDSTANGKRTRITSTRHSPETNPDGLFHGQAMDIRIHALSGRLRIGKYNSIIPVDSIPGTRPKWAIKANLPEPPNRGGVVELGSAEEVELRPLSTVRGSAGSGKKVTDVMVGEGGDVILNANKVLIRGAVRGGDAGKGAESVRGGNVDVHGWKSVDISSIATDAPAASVIGGAGSGKGGDVRLKGDQTVSIMHNASVVGGESGARGSQPGGSVVITGTTVDVLSMPFETPDGQVEGSPGIYGGRGSPLTPAVAGKPAVAGGDGGKVAIEADKIKVAGTIRGGRPGVLANDKAGGSVDLTGRTKVLFDKSGKAWGGPGNGAKNDPRGDVNIVTKELLADGVKQKTFKAKRFSGGIAQSNNGLVGLDQPLATFAGAEDGTIEADESICIYVDGGLLDLSEIDPANTKVFRVLSGQPDSIGLNAGDYLFTDTGNMNPDDIADFAFPPAMIDGGCPLGNGSCFGDLNQDGQVDEADLGFLLMVWGSEGYDGADLDGDDQVDATDLGLMLAAWGPCWDD